jgi:hypothetical protein
MPVSIDTIFPSYATDYVAVFDQNYTQIFKQARAIKATIKEQAKVMEHPVESGIIITDHRIILPIEIELSLILQSPDYEDVYKTIRSYYLNGTLLTVQTRAGIYNNQIISSMPHEEDPSIYDALTIALNLKQVQFVTAQFGIVPKKSSNYNLTNRGTQQGTPAPPEKVSTAAIAFRGAEKYIKKQFTGLTGAAGYGATG